MFEDLRYLLKESRLSESIKVPLTVLIKAVAWVPWLFVAVGLILSKEFFVYWLAFFLFVEGLLIAALIYVLVVVIRTSVGSTEAVPTTQGSSSAASVADAAVKGIVGNAAFYLFLLAAFVIAKGMGVVDALWQALVKRVGGP